MYIYIYIYIYVYIYIYIRTSADCAILSYIANIISLPSSHLLEISNMRNVHFPDAL